MCFTRAVKFVMSDSDGTRSCSLLMVCLCLINAVSVWE